MTTRNRNQTNLWSDSNLGENRELRVLEALKFTGTYSD